MNTFNPRPWRFAALFSVALPVLTATAGCADVNWSRAFYEGQRAGAQQCQWRAPADGRRCAELPTYDRYEKERARLAAPAAPAASAAPAAPAASPAASPGAP